MPEDEDGTCYFIGGPLDGKLYAFPRRVPIMYFPVIEEHWTRWEPDLNPDKKAEYKHIINEIYWYTGTR